MFALVLLAGAAALLWRYLRGEPTLSETASGGTTASGTGKAINIGQAGSNYDLRDGASDTVAAALTGAPPDSAFYVKTPTLEIRSIPDKPGGLLDYIKSLVQTGRMIWTPAAGTYMPADASAWKQYWAGYQGLDAYWQLAALVKSYNPFLKP